MTTPAPPPEAPRGRPLVRSLEDAAALVMRPVRSLLGMVMPDDAPLELQLVGRVVLHAIVVGLTVGAAGCVFLLLLDELQALVLDGAARYPYLRAAGERTVEVGAGGPRLWVVVLAPMLGALVAGLCSRWAPEIRGGGGDAMIEAFHHHGGAMRRRVIALKPLASIAVLGSGGAGGREGPTMQLGGALGAWVARVFTTSERERRVLMIAGVAAGISAVFRTPLGAAILAIEVLYRDDFESEALIPAVLASVVAYSLSASVLTTAPMFGELPRFPFYWQHLPYYAVVAILVAASAAIFVACLRVVQRHAPRLPVPTWMRPAVGGLALGGAGAIALVTLPAAFGLPASYLSVLGGGYGAGQLAITGTPALGSGGTAALALLACAALRVLGTSLTIGTGGSAGDFAPSLAIGALVGGALGHAADAWFDTAGLAPGAFALVGMATFYGGAAKTPLAATVMICEMAGSYDLLVPLMLSQAIAFVALRRTSLYPAQVAAQHDSPVHAAAWARRSIASLHAGELIRPGRIVVVLAPGDPAEQVLRVMADAPDQAVFPVVDARGGLVGLVTGLDTREIATVDDTRWAVAADLMQAPASVTTAAPLVDVARLLLERDLRAVPVVDARGAILDLLDEHDVSRAYVRASDGKPGRAAD